MYGGFDGMAVLGDLWELRLGAVAGYVNASVAEQRRAQQCAWRLLPGVTMEAWVAQCDVLQALPRYLGVQDAPPTGQPLPGWAQEGCDPETVMTVAWCLGWWQAVRG